MGEIYANMDSKHVIGGIEYDDEVLKNSPSIATACETLIEKVWTEHILPKCSDDFKLIKSADIYKKFQIDMITLVHSEIRKMRSIEMRAVKAVLGALGSLDCVPGIFKKDQKLLFEIVRDDDKRLYATEDILKQALDKSSVLHRKQVIANPFTKKASFATTISDTQQPQQAEAEDNDDEGEFVYDTRPLTTIGHDTLEVPHFFTKPVSSTNPGIYNSGCFVEILRMFFGTLDTDAEGKVSLRFNNDALKQITRTAVNALTTNSVSGRLPINDIDITPQKVAFVCYKLHLVFIDDEVLANGVFKEERIPFIINPEKATKEQKRLVKEDRLKYNQKVYDYYYDLATLVAKFQKEFPLEHNTLLGCPFVIKLEAEEFSDDE